MGQSPTFPEALDFVGDFFAAPGSVFEKKVTVKGVGSPRDGAVSGGGAIIEGSTFKEGLVLEDVYYNIQDSEVKNKGMGCEVKAGSSGTISNSTFESESSSALAFGGDGDYNPNIHAYKVTCKTQGQDPALLISKAKGEVDIAICESQGEVDMSCSLSTLQLGHINCKKIGRASCRERV